MALRNKYSEKKVLNFVFCCSADSYATAAYFGSSNKYVAANATPGATGGEMCQPFLDPNKQYYITKIEALSTVAPGAGEDHVYTVYTDYTTKYTFAASTSLTCTVSDTSTTAEAVGLNRIDSTTSVYIEIDASGSAASTACIVKLTVEER